MLVLRNKIVEVVYDSFSNNRVLFMIQIATEAQMKFGMGIRIVILEAKPGGQTSLAQLISEAKPSGKLTVRA